MAGWLLVNHFVQDDEYLELQHDFLEAARRAGIALTRRTNVEVAPLTGYRELECEPPDFVLFWCKDLQLAFALEAAGLRLFNSAEAIRLSDDKSATVSALARSPIAQPRTVTVPRSDTTTDWTNTGFVEACVAALGLPMVIKETRGSFGQEVHLAQTQTELLALFNRLSGKDCIVQEFIASSAGHDVRAQVVGGRVIGAIERFSTTGDFRANISSGASYRPHALAASFEATAITACKELGLDFAGVDLMFGEDGTPLLCEVNSNAHSIPEMRECCNVNVADEIMAHIAASLGL